jgi:hypothetical protein
MDGAVTAVTDGGKRAVRSARYVFYSLIIATRPGNDNGACKMLME